MLKDIKLAVEACNDVGQTSLLGKHSIDVYDKIVEKGCGKKDFSVVYDLLKSNDL